MGMGLCPTRASRASPAINCDLASDIRQHSINLPSLLEEGTIILLVCVVAPGNSCPAGRLR